MYITNYELITPPLFVSPQISFWTQIKARNVVQFSKIEYN